MTVPVKSVTRTKAGSFRDLEIWQRSIELVEEIYKVTKSFPQEEMYGISSQLRRAAVSIPSNIAEGFVRFFGKEFRQFLYVSLGSCAEVSTQIVIANRLGYLEQKKADVLSNEIEQISKMIMGLIKKVKAVD